MTSRARAKAAPTPPVSTPGVVTGVPAAVAAPSAASSVISAAAATTATSAATAAAANPANGGATVPAAAAAAAAATSLLNSSSSSSSSPNATVSAPPPPSQATVLTAPFPSYVTTPSSQLIVHVLRLAPGADLHASLLQFLRNHRAEAATIISGVGSLTHANIRFANVPDEAVKPQPVGHYEIVSLNGTMSLTGGNHIHIAIADTKGTTLGGHLMPTGNRVYTTVELVIGVLPGLVFKREKDPTYGYQELVVYPNKMNPLTTFAGADMSMFFTQPMPVHAPSMAAMPQSIKRKAEEDSKVAGSAAKKPKSNAKVKKEAGEEKENKSKSGINPSALTLANMPLVMGNSLTSPNSAAALNSALATSPTSGGASSSAKKPQAQLWTPAQFSVFLKSLKLDHLVPIFQWNKVDAKQFLELKLTDIRDRLGIRESVDKTQCESAVSGLVDADVLLCSFPLVLPTSRTC
jgi:predicted DNA-binding protein with PD1-like motif